MEGRREVLILIHTSVKLVTVAEDYARLNARILIHTSVKLVTRPGCPRLPLHTDFNPHEREARDTCGSMMSLCWFIF